MSRRRRRGVPTANGTAPTTPVPPKTSTLPYVRERDTLGVLRVDGHEVITVEPVIGTDGKPTTAERLLLDDDRVLYGCTRCDVVSTAPRSITTHNRTHSTRYSPEVRKVVDRAVARALARAEAKGTSPEVELAAEPVLANGTEPTAEEITATLESGPIRDELDRISAEPAPEPAQPRSIVDIARDIAEVTDRLEALKAEMRAAVAG